MGKMNSLDQTFKEIQADLEQIRINNLVLKKDIQKLNAKLKGLKTIYILTFLGLFALIFIK